MFTFESRYHKLMNSKRIILFFGLITSMATFGISLLFPLFFRSDAQVLIIPKSRYGVDPYTVVKSAERVGENIVQIMKTKDFYDKVMATVGNRFDKSRYENTSITEVEKRKRWAKDINANVVFGTGVLNISSYNTDPAQAIILSGAIANTLVDKAQEYVGGDVTIKVVNDPVVTRFPARPNFVFNAVLGYICGMIIMSLGILRRQ